MPAKKYFGAYRYDAFSNGKQGPLEVSRWIDSLSPEALHPVVSVDAENATIAKVLIKEKIARLKSMP